MKVYGINDAVFVTVVRSLKAEKEVSFMVESIRTFAGPMSKCPVWVYTRVPQKQNRMNLGGLGTEVVHLEIPDSIAEYIFADAVSACALAEDKAKGKFRSLIWIDTSCLVVQPPLLMNLGPDADAAVRPVHVRNVGRLAAEPPDGYWQGIFNALGVRDVSSTVASFVDDQRIRSYFNTHSFAVNPDKGLMKRWLELFEKLVTDKGFQSDYCSDEVHKIFLFQAILSTLLVSVLDEERIRILPPSYNYPYNLHDKLPEDRRAKALDELTTFTYEGRKISPGEMADIEIGVSLKTWLAERT
ncbi:hypothetical protein JXM67_10520 [candidate division WOR-3 bacterium]|nr:hypothetical protein [candidate division WOR-3 bacterium]